MKYYKLDPEVAGGFGENTKLDTSEHPPIVSHLHYQFDGWLGDCLLESFPCYIFTKDLAEAIKENKFSGINFTSVETSKSEEFVDINGDITLPEFLCGEITKDKDNDFYIDTNHCLVVSGSALKVIESYQLEYCDKEEIK